MTVTDVFFLSQLFEGYLCISYMSWSCYKLVILGYISETFVYLFFSEQILNLCLTVRFAKFTKSLHYTGYNGFLMTSVVEFFYISTAPSKLSVCSFFVLTTFLCRCLL